MHLTVQDVAALVGAGSACYGVVRGMPLLADRAKLVRERNGAIDMAREARDAAEAYRISSDGWQSAVERLREQVGELTSEVHTLRHQLAQAVVYITQVQQSARNGEPIPEMPHDLRAAFAEVQRPRPAAATPSTTSEESAWR